MKNEDFFLSCSAQTWRERPTEQSCPPSKPRESFLTLKGAVFLFPSREQTIAATSLFSEVAQEVRFSFLKIISFVSFFYSKLKFIFFRSELLLHSPLWMLSSNVLHEIHTFCCFYFYYFWISWSVLIHTRLHTHRHTHTSNTGSSAGRSWIEIPITCTTLNCNLNCRVFVVTKSKNLNGNWRFWSSASLYPRQN